MAVKKISLHFASPARKYSGQDAICLARLAKRLGFEEKLFVTPAPTGADFLSETKSALDRLEEDGLLFISFSGHGALTGSEHHLKQYWQFSEDDKVLDYQIRAVLKRSARFATIFVLADACFSGDSINTVIKLLNANATSPDSSASREFLLNQLGNILKDSAEESSSNKLGGRERAENTRILLSATGAKIDGDLEHPVYAKTFDDAQTESGLLPEAILTVLGFRTPDSKDWPTYEQLCGLIVKRISRPFKNAEDGKMLNGADFLPPRLWIYPSTASRAAQKKAFRT